MMAFLLDGEDVAEAAGTSEMDTKQSSLDSGRKAQPDMEKTERRSARPCTAL